MTRQHPLPRRRRRRRLRQQPRAHLVVARRTQRDLRRHHLTKRPNHRGRNLARQLAGGRQRPAQALPQHTAQRIDVVGQTRRLAAQTLRAGIRTRRPPVRQRQPQTKTAHRHRAMLRHPKRVAAQRPMPQRQPRQLRQRRQHWRQPAAHRRPVLTLQRLRHILRHAVHTLLERAARVHRAQRRLRLGGQTAYHRQITLALLRAAHPRTPHLRHQHLAVQLRVQGAILGHPRLLRSQHALLKQKLAPPLRDHHIPTTGRTGKMGQRLQLRHIQMTLTPWTRDLQLLLRSFLGHRGLFFSIVDGTPHAAPRYPSPLGFPAAPAATACTHSLNAFAHPQQKESLRTSVRRPHPHPACLQTHRRPRHRMTHRTASLAQNRI